jgi:hypothetical protein
MTAAATVRALICYGVLTIPHNRTCKKETRVRAVVRVKYLIAITHNVKSRT